MRTLLIDPFGGLAGDMFLAALLDLEDPRLGLAELQAFAEAVLPGECRLECSEVRRGSLRARLLRVRTPETSAPPPRHLEDLLELLGRAPLGEAARERAGDVLRALGAAEARVHGCSVEEVHFHEVGAVDTLIDVGGALLGLERLGVEVVHSTAPLVGEGTVHCAHGELPVPPPAVAELLRGLPSRRGGGPGERLTPTGAALLATLVDSFEPPPEFRAQALGYGAGERESRAGPPNLVRVELGAVAAPSATPRGQAWLLEFNLDDTTGEEVGHCLGELRLAGALEAWSSPVQMKKDRPGVVVTALCRADRRAEMERAAFDHTPTLGLRWSPRERSECRRETLEVQLRGSRVRIVRRLRPGSRPTALDLSPEYEDLAALARQTGLPLRELEREAVARCLARDSG